MQRVLVIGLDGVPLPFLKMLVARGVMPRVGELIRRGTHGQLESVFPPVTAPAWTSFATGKTPDNHGCFDFVVPDGSLSRLRVVTSQNIRASTIYEIAEDAGKHCILVNLPVSSPPRLRHGITVTDFLTVGSDWVFPPNLRDEIPQLGRYRMVPDPRPLGEGRLPDHLRDIGELERVRFECARELFVRKPWELFFVLFSGSDWVQHVVFDELARGELDRYPEAVAVYRDLDSYVGWFLDQLPPATTVLVLSDHGFTVFRGRFCVNTWLRDQGYLATSDTPTIERPRFDFIEEVMAVRAKRTRIPVPRGVYRWISRHGRVLALADRLYKWVRPRLGIEVRPIPLEVDIRATAAYMITSEAMGIYLNDRSRYRDGVLSEEESVELREKILAGLRDLRDDDGRTVIVARRREEVFRGPWAHLGPDVLLYEQDYSVFGPVFPMTLARKPTNNHSPFGILLAYGPEIRAGAEVNGRIVDVAPTVLHLLGLRVPSDMDGRVLLELFTSGSAARAHEAERVTTGTGAGAPPPSSDPTPDEAIVMDRLRQLGYLD